MTLDLQTPKLRALGNWLLHRALRVTFIEVSLEEVAKSAYDHSSPSFPDLGNVDLSDDKRWVLLDEYSKSVEADINRRHERIDAKLRGLQAATGLISSLVTGLALNGNPIVVVAVLPLITCALLATRGLGLHVFQNSTINSDEAKFGDLRMVVLTARLQAANWNTRVLDFISDIYRASCRYFIAALAILPILFVISLIWA
jgi:hypothetical protein